MTRRARAAVVLALSAFAIAGPYAATATAAPDQPSGGERTPMQVAPNATPGSFCILDGNICLF